MIKKFSIVILLSASWFSTVYALADFGFVNNAKGVVSITCRKPSLEYYTLTIGNHVHFQCQEGSDNVSVNYGGIPVTNTWVINQQGGCWDIYVDKHNWVKLDFRKAVRSACGMS